MSAIPRGYVRHPVSGCIIPEASIDSHELALTERQLRHAQLAPSRNVELSSAEAAVDAKVSELRELEARVAAKVASLKSQLGEGEASTPKAS